MNEVVADTASVERDGCAAARSISVDDASFERWPRSFGQFSENFKWNVRDNHAADLIAGSVAKYASSGV